MPLRTRSQLSAIPRRRPHTDRLSIEDSGRAPAPPLYIAALGPSNVAATAEVADGWIPVFFHPDKARSVWSDVLAKGAAKRDPALGLPTLPRLNQVWPTQRAIS